MLRMAFFAVLLCAPAWPTAAQDVQLKDLGRFIGWRDSALVGYGVVTGLSGSGDSPGNEVTRRALANVLGRLGSNVGVEQVRSRNVAAVIVTARLPATANLGDTVDVTVTSVGDARSLAGGSLLMTQLLGPDGRPYALAQGALVVGGYQFEDSFNLRQKNFPTAGTVPGGATIEKVGDAPVIAADGPLTFVLATPDFTTATRVADVVEQSFGRGAAVVRGPDAVRIRVPAGGDAVRFAAQVEALRVAPGDRARVVVNERSGTVVAGGDVQISTVVVAQGDIQVAIQAYNEASQPYIVGGFAPNARSLIVTNTRLEVEETGRTTVTRLPATTVGDLVAALSRARVSVRDMIAVLQATKAAGALHADIIVQ